MKKRSKKKIDTGREKAQEKATRGERAIPFLFYALLFISPLVYYTHIQDFSNLPKATFIQFVSCLLLIFWLLRARAIGRIETVRHPVIIAIGLWLLWSGITILWSSDRFAGIALWLHWLMCAACFFVFINTIRTTEELERIVLFSVLGAAVISVIGILQYAVAWDFIPQGAIPGGTFSNRNVAVQFIVIVWPFSLLMFFMEKDRLRYWFWAFAHALIMIFLLYSRTRAGWAAILFSILILGLFLSSSVFRRDIRGLMPRDKTMVLIASVIFIIAMAMVPQRTTRGQARTRGYMESLASISGYEDSSRIATAEVRMALYRNSIKIIRDNPLVGVGLAAWQIHYPMYQRAARADPIFSSKEQPEYMENDPLQVLVETSTLGLALYASMFIVILWRALIALRSTKEASVRLRVIFGVTAIIAFNIDSLFTFPLRMAIPPLFLMIIFGYLVSLDLQAITKGTLLNNVTNSEKRIEEREKRTPVKQGLDSPPARGMTGWGPVKKGMINVLIALLLIFAILLTGFNYRMILGDYHYLRSSYFNMVKDWRAAGMEARKAVGYIPWRHRLWFELGKADDNLGMDDEAIEAYMNALKAHPNHLNSLVNLGHMYLKKKDFTNAAPPTLKALEIEPDFDLALFNMGLINEAQGKTREAAEYYMKAVRANPKYTEARFLLGVIFLKEKSLAEAREQFEKVAEIKPDTPGVHFNLGLVYDRLRMTDKAEAEYRKETAVNPKNADAYNNLGLIYTRGKRWEEAASFYREALRLNPDLGAAHVNIAVAYYALKDYGASWRHARIGERLGIPQAKDIIEGLKKVAKEPN
jgi:tetratricopeptide (TPR) repeat protein/O-antigen ligase